MPSLPAGSALRFLAIAGTVALAAFMAAAVVEAVQRRWSGAGWGFGALAAGLVTMALGHRHPAVHALASFLTLAIALRNAWVFRSWSRALEIVAILGWVGALVAARMLFG